jgi:tetratricopeptide (TPR) repeat protein
MGSEARYGAATSAGAPATPIGATPTAAAPEGRASWGVPLLLALAVFACFLPALAGDFVNWDDDANFLENPSYRGLSPSHLGWMFTTFHMGHYQPLTWMTLGLDYELWGMHAGGYHFTSLALHSASTILFYFFLLALLERAGRPIESAGSRESRWPAALGALFFAVHPLRVESVVWATERKDVLCGFFVMITLITYLRHEREDRAGRPGRKWLILSVAAFACSLLSKALGIMLPIVLLVLDVYPLGRFVPGQRRRVLLEKLPYFGAAALDGWLSLLAGREVELVRPFQGYGLLARVEEAAFGLCFYLWKTVMPLRLSPLYPAPKSFNTAAAVFVASLVAVVLISVLVVVFRRRFPAGLAAWACYSALLFPVLGLIQAGPQIAADRYTYLSCVPWAVVLAFLLKRVARTGGSPGSLPRAPMAALLTAGGILLILGSLTFAQACVWKDSISLWDHALRVNPTNTTAYNNRGTARAARMDRKGAIEDFDQAIRLYPDFAEALYNRGNMKRDAGDLEGAIADETEAIRVSPSYGQAYFSRGKALEAKGSAEKARADYAEASRIENLLASSLGPRGKSAARPTLSDSAEVQARNNEGNLKASKGDFDGAIASYSQALKIDPKIAAVYNNRGNARASRGDQKGAVADYSEALKLDPGFAEAYANRGMSLALLGDLRGAVEDYTEALRIAPRDPVVYGNRGVARAKLGDRSGATQDLETALATAPPDWPRRGVVQALLARLKGR